MGVGREVFKTVLGEQSGTQGRWVGDLAYECLLCVLEVGEMAEEQGEEAFGEGGWTWTVLVKS